MTSKKNLPQITTTFKIFNNSFNIPALTSTKKQELQKSKASVNVTTCSTRLNPSSTKSKETSQREAYSHELKTFIENSLQIVAEKVAYKKSLEAMISANSLEYQKLREEIERLEGTNKELKINCITETENCNKLKERNNELEDLLAFLNDKIEDFNHNLHSKLEVLKEVQNTLTNELITLRENLKNIIKLKREERKQLKKEIEGIEATCYSVVGRLEEINGEISKSKTIKSEQLKMLTRNSSVLTSLTQMLNTKNNTLNKTIARTVKTTRIIRSKSICKNTYP